MSGCVLCTVNDVANWFLANTSGVTNKKLQKLVYYAYSWYLVFNNESPNHITARMFDNHFEAWVHGAVDSNLYDEYRDFGSRVITKYTGKLFDFSPDDLDLLQQVNEVYGKYNGNDLEDICHQESPWINARGGLPPYAPSHEKILDADIYECYAGRLD